MESNSVIKTEDLRIDLNGDAMTAQMNSSKKKKYSIISIKNKKKKESKDAEMIEEKGRKKKTSFANFSARGNYISAREISENLKTKSGAETAREKTFRSLPNMNIDSDMIDDTTNSTVPSISPSSPPSPQCEVKESKFTADLNKRNSLSKIFGGNTNKKKKKKLVSMGDSKSESTKESGPLPSSQFPPPPAHFYSHSSSESKKRGVFIQNNNEGQSHHSNHNNNNHNHNDNRNSMSVIIKSSQQNQIINEINENTILNNLKIHSIENIINDNNNNNNEFNQAMKVIVTKTRIAENENELSVVIGDELLVKMPLEEGGWCFASLHGRSGYVPIDVSTHLENVDITSIIEYKEENKCTLGKNLENRPDVDELIERNILTESSSPFLNEQKRKSAEIQSSDVFEDAADHLSPEERAVRLFSTKPSQGIAKLIEYRIVENTPQSIADYLFKSPLPPRDVVGNYLGDPGDFVAQVRDCYLDHLVFQGLEFDKALRLFLFYFKLPGEAQKIDRIMQTFARKYFTQYSGHLFSHEDTVYILAYATIMLNTDLHNPYVKKKMTLAEFIHNNRDIDQGKSLPVVFLQDLYQRILDDEIKTRNDDLFPKAIKRGYLMVKKKKKLSRYWIVLDKDSYHLYYFTLETDTKPVQSFNLQFVNIKKQAITRKKKKYFPILLEYKEEAAKGAEIKLLSPSQRLWVEWLTCIGDCIQEGRST